MICPKCQYQRKPADTAPDWQCPACGIAYQKYLQSQAAPATPSPQEGIERTDKARIHVYREGPDDSSDGLLYRILGVLAAVIGAWLGLMMLVPLVLTFAIAKGASEISGERKSLVVPAFSVQAAHCLWLAFGILFAPGGDTAINELEALLYAAGLIWLYVKPSRQPIYWLAGYQVVGVLINMLVFASTDLDSPNGKALIVHMLMRGTALFLLSKMFVALAPKEDDQELAP